MKLNDPSWVVLLYTEVIASAFQLKVNSIRFLFKSLQNFLAIRIFIFGGIINTEMIHWRFSG